MDKETAEWARILFPKTLQWKLVKLAESFQNLFFWWR